jgi:hypothetical protein
LLSLVAIESSHVPSLHDGNSKPPDCARRAADTLRRAI